MPIADSHKLGASTHAANTAAQTADDTEVPTEDPEPPYRVAPQE